MDTSNRRLIIVSVEENGEIDLALEGNFFPTEPVLVLEEAAAYAKRIEQTNMFVRMKQEHEAKATPPKLYTPDGGKLS